MSAVFRTPILLKFGLGWFGVVVHKDGGGNDLCFVLCIDSRCSYINQLEI